MRLRRLDHLESDLSGFLTVKNKHEMTTGRPIDDDLLITLLMQKTMCPVQQQFR